jgi:hypothetical protein
MHHLEQMVPFAVTAVPNQSMQSDDGIVTVYDMNTRDNLKFYNEDKYWNMDLKDEFMDSTRGLWKGNFDDKRRGNIFQSEGAGLTQEEELTVSKFSDLTDFLVRKSRKRNGCCYCKAWTCG